MERSEPTLVPEWLKNAGSSSGGGSVSHSDDHSPSRVARNRLNGNGHGLGRSSSSERTTSSYFRRSSSSNSSGNFRSYSSFGRNQRDRDWEKDTYDSRDHDKSILGDRRHRDFSDTLLSKYERDGLRRSQSIMISGKRGETWPKKVVTESTSSSGKNSNGLLPGKGSPVGGGVNKATIKRDFPSLGAAEERGVIPEVGRVPSPVLTTAFQSLPIGTSASIGGKNWTSALAEVPILVGSNETGLSSVQQAVPSRSTSVASGLSTSLNMAEAVAQGPNRAQTSPQLSVGTQRLEELAIKQSRQLIPVTPSMPKTLVLNSSDKQKTKAVQQQHPVSSSLPVNHSPRGGPVKADVSKVSNVGKLHVLKPVREKNGVTSVAKDTLSPTSSGGKVVSSTASAAPPPGPDHRKPVLTALEKRPTSQAQSRNDFFNSVRKKSMANPSSPSDSAVENSSSAVSPSFDEKHSANTPQDADVALNLCPRPQDADVALNVSPRAQDCDVELNVSLRAESLSEEKKGECVCNGDAQKCVSNGNKNPSFDPIISEEEEAAFLRSMGWQENDEEGGLTEEEINAFFRDVVTKYIDTKPSPLGILQGGVQQKVLLQFNSQIGGIGGISSGLNSSDAKLES